LCLGLCALFTNVHAQEQKTWPVTTNLMVPDWVVDKPDAWKPVGTVTFKNSNSNYLVEVFPDDPYQISDVAIHVVEANSADEAMNDISGLLDKKTGKPKVGKFDFKRDYLGDDGIPSTYHYQLISLDNYDECWAQNLEACPGLYTIVAVNLVEPDGNEWNKLPDTAFAEESTTFARLDKLDGRVWAWFVTYQRARALAGHFVDANVNGLTYETLTQYGLTEYATDSGTTGQDGQFWFLPGEQIRFHVGNLYLGEALADRRLDPTDLFESSDLDDDRVINMAWLLQTLDTDGTQDRGAINISEEAAACLNNALSSRYGTSLPAPEALFRNTEEVEALIDDTFEDCAEDLAIVTRDQARENLNTGMQAGNLMKRNISKTPEMASDKAKIEILPVYVPSQDPKGYLKDVVYYDADGDVIETRNKAKPIVVTYLDEVGYNGAFDVFVAISRDDGDTWKRRNISRTADKFSNIGYPGHSEKPMLKVKGNKIFVAWTDKYCNGGRPGYAITVCDTLDVDSDGDGVADTCEICRETDEGTKCANDYRGDDHYWQDDLFGVAGPQRSVFYEDFPQLGEVSYSCVWTSRAIVEPDGNIQWFKPERLTSGRRDAYQLFAAAGTGAGFAIVWQEDPKGLMTGEGHGPGDGWSGANTHNKADIWYSYITLEDFGKIDTGYPAGEFGEQDFVDSDPDMIGRVKALVPMSLPVRVSDNEVCSLENMNPTGGHGEHDFDGEGQGTHRYCGAYDDVVDATPTSPSSSPLCAYTVEKTNPKDEVHHVCVTADGRLLDGNTGASRANVFLQPKAGGGAWAIIGYEESKGVGTRPEDEEGCGDEEALLTDSDTDHDDRYKPDMGKNVIYHSFDFANPEVVGSGDIINLPETDDAGNIVLLRNEDGSLYQDWEGNYVPAYENARRIRFISQPETSAKGSGLVLVALYRQGEEGGGKPADIFMRRMVLGQDSDTSNPNPYRFGNFTQGAQNLSSVTPTVLWTNPYDTDAPEKMLRWGWSPANLNDKSAANPHTDARAHRGALSGDELIIGYIWTPNWGRRGNDKYDFYIRRSFNGGKSWTTDPKASEAIEHHVVFRVPVLDPDTQTVTWEDEVMTTSYGIGVAEPPRNVSNLRNNRVSVLEPRLVKTPGTIKPPLFPEDTRKPGIYQVAYGLEFNQNTLPEGVVFPQMPLDIYYSRTKDRGQRYESVIVTPQGGNGQPEEGWNLLAKDKPEQGAVQVRQTPDGSRMYGIWLEEGDGGSDIMFRRVDYRP
jgi:hypothetical protein